MIIKKVNKYDNKKSKNMIIQKVDKYDNVCCLQNFKTKMTRTYIRKTQTTYTELAVEQIKKGKVSPASEVCSIPKATLHKPVHNKLQSHGRGTATVLSTSFVFVLVSVLISLADWGFGRTFADVIAIVRSYLVSKNLSRLFPPNVRLRIVLRFHETITS